MARRKNPCDFCEDSWTSDYVEGRNGFCLWYEVYPFNHVISCIAQGNDEEGELIEGYVSIEMNFCPVCGRRLEE